MADRKQIEDAADWIDCELFDASRGNEAAREEQKRNLKILRDAALRSLDGVVVPMDAYEGFVRMVQKATGKPLEDITMPRLLELVRAMLAAASEQGGRDE